ncbi:MAG: PEP-CTERM sorting domain-containing protein, partial [Planctomycetota bacterium]
PESVTTSPGSTPNQIDNLRNQSGLATPYQSGVTNFDSYVATTTGGVNNGRSPNGGVNNGPPAQFNFRFSDVIIADRIALWSANGISTVVDFDLIGSLSGDFTDAQTIGSFTNTIFGANPLANVFSFNEIKVRALRVQATSNVGFPAFTGFDEFATGGIAVPEPSSLTLLGIVGTLAMIGRQRSKK